MTNDDLELQKEILDLRQEYEKTKHEPPPPLSDALLRALALREDEDLTWRAIADRLNEEGFLTERGRPWIGANVWNHLRAKGLYFEERPRETFRKRVLTQPRDYHGRWKKED